VTKRKLYSFDELDKILDERGFRHIKNIRSDPFIHSDVELEVIYFDNPKSDVTTEEITIVDRSMRVRKEDGTEFYLLDSSSRVIGYKVTRDPVIERIIGESSRSGQDF